MWEGSIEIRLNDDLKTESGEAEVLIPSDKRRPDNSGNKLDYIIKRSDQHISITYEANDKSVGEYVASIRLS